MTAKVINPRLPTSIKRAITVCPKRVQWVAVLTRVNPVTQVALVDVKKAVIKLVWRLLAVEHGSNNKTVPMAITTKNPKVNNLGNE